jgi:hypothetical protein
MPAADSSSQSVSTSTIAAPATTTPAANNAVAAGLNPEHGQPGHRCDIAVGAPLNSPAGANTMAAPAISTAPAPAMAQPQMPAQPAGKNARLNPAHGQPGHDCSVPVGQPLKG